VLASRPVVTLALAASLSACTGRGPVAGSSADGALSLSLSDVVTGLASTTDVAFLPDGRMVITEKEGSVKVRGADGGLTLAGSFDVDATNEKGMLGVAVDPDFARTRRLFLYHCVDPVYHCRHGAAAGGIDGDCDSITGGAIVDTPAWPATERGRYYFADNVNGRLWSVAVDAARSSVVAGSRREVARVERGIPVSLRLGPEGDLYIAVLPGRVAKLAPAAQALGARR